MFPLQGSISYINVTMSVALGLIKFHNIISTLMEFINMDTTTILPTPPTSGAIVQSSGKGYDNGLSDLILSNNIADNSRAVLTAVSGGNAAIIAADQAGHLINQKTTGDASVANLKATYDAQVAGINATNLGVVSTTKSVTDNGFANISSTERNSSEIRQNLAKESGETRLATAISNGEIRELINLRSAENQMAIKDNLTEILKEGSKTREKFAEHFAALELQAERNKNDIEKEVLKGNAALALQACKDTAALSAQIAKCCCENEMLQKDTQALILKQTQDRKNDELLELRFKLLAVENKIPLVTVAA